MTTLSQVPHRDVPIHRNLSLALSSANFFTLGVIVASSGPALDEFSLQTGSNLAAVGGVFTAIFLGALAAQVFGAPLVDRLSPRRLLPFAMLLMGLGALGLTQARALWLYLLLAGISGLGQGMVDIASHVMVSRLFAERRASALNLLNVFFGAGAFIGPAISGLTLRHFSTALPALWIGGGLGLILIPLAYYWLPGGRGGENSGAKHPAAGEVESATPYRSPQLWLFGAMLLLYVGMENGMGGWSSIYLQRTVNALPETGAALTSGFWLALALGRIAAIFVGARFSAQRLLAASLVVTLAGTLVLGLGSGSLAGSAAGLLLIGFGFGPIFPTTIALTTTTFAHVAGRATGAVVALGSLGGMIIPWLQGALILSVGPGITPWLALAFGLGMLASAALVGRKETLTSKV